MRTVCHRLPRAALLGTVFTAIAFAVEADDAACRAVLNAIVKQATVPVHQKMSIESAAAPGKVLHSEVIRVGGSLYIHIQGKWKARPYDGRKAVEDARQAMARSEHRCARVERVSVNGEAADLYQVESKTPQGDSEARIWISSATGLPLRQRTVTTQQNAARMQHEVVFDYANVEAPTDVIR